MSKIKLLYILHAVGGVEVWLRLILSQLDTTKFEVVVVHGNTDTDTPFILNNGQIAKTYRTTIDRKIHPYFDSVAIKNCVSFINKEKPDIVHCHSAKAGIIGKMAGYLTKTKTYYTPHAYSYLSTESSVKRTIFLCIEKLFSKLNNRVIACSKSEMNRAIDEVGYKPKNVFLFKNAIPQIKQISESNLLAGLPESFICSIGRPSYQKNIVMMVNVIAEVKKQIPDIHLVLMGVGYHAPDLEKIKKQITTLELDKNITLLEWTARVDVLSIINKSKLYISTSRYEGLPYSIIEAMALSKACVVTDADGNRDLIENEVNGFVIPNNDVELFASKVNLILNNENLRESLQQQTKAIFDKEYHIENTIIKLEELYLIK